MGRDSPVGRLNTNHAIAFDQDRGRGSVVQNRRAVTSRRLREAVERSVWVGKPGAGFERRERDIIRTHQRLDRPHILGTDDRGLDPDRLLRGDVGAQPRFVLGRHDLEKADRFKPW